MYNQPFYMPGYYSASMPNIASGAIPGIARGAMMPTSAIGGAMNTAGMASRGGLFSRLGNTFGILRSFNWGGLINNTSKTLGIINQTIPLVRQVGPMVNNMRSMLKVASVFKDETDNNFKTKQTNNNYSQTQNSQTQTVNTKQDNVNKNIDTNKKIEEKKEEAPITYSNMAEAPTFFIN